jgi:DNA-directed RNA polymerase subunit N (RpoN/RPB10)
MINLFIYFLKFTNEMIIPVRCFTCNAVIAHKWNIYKKTVEQYIADGVEEINVRGIVLDELGFTVDKYCCRRMFLGHVDIIDNLLMYSNNPGETGISKHEYFSSKVIEQDEPENEEEESEESEEESEEEFDEEVEYGMKITKQVENDEQLPEDSEESEDDEPDEPDDQDYDDQDYDYD